MNSKNFNNLAPQLKPILEQFECLKLKSNDQRMLLFAKYHKQARPNGELCKLRSWNGKTEKFKHEEKI